MKFIKKLAPFALALSATACIGLDDMEITGIQMGSGISSDGSKKVRLGKFSCENGYNVTVGYKSEERIYLKFNNGDNTFVVPANIAPSGSGALYIGEPNTVKWHEKGGNAIFNFPDNNYRDNGKIQETRCKLNK